MLLKRTPVIFLLMITSSLSFRSVSLRKDKENKENHDESSERGITLFHQSEWQKDGYDLESELAFARALGAGVDQDLEGALLSSNSLISVGAARAHTTLALFLNHNLTGDSNLSKSEREAKASTLYLTAAIKGDPIAQIITGQNYLINGDCSSSVDYYHRAASHAIQNIQEMVISTPSLVRHIWEEDNLISSEEFPSQEQMDFLEHIAISGKSDAALKVATLLITGPSAIKRDMEKAHKYLRQAVEANETFAMVFLGQLHIRGLIEQDDQEALKLLRQALKYGNELAHSGIGIMYMEGRGGLEKDFAKAEYHFKKGIEAGNIDSFYQLGNLYSLMPGNKIRQAVDLWKVPASLGHVHAAWNLAEYFYSDFQNSVSRTVLSLKSTDIGLQSCKNAVILYRIVSHAGEWKELLDDAFEDYKAGKKGPALMKYLLLSDLGYSSAHVNAGRILDEGGADIYIDESARVERAFEMWLRSSKDGVAKGHVRLGDYYYYGMGEIKQNRTMAAQHYSKSTSMGDSEGGFSLASLIEWGDGVRQNVSKAEEIYYKISEENSEAVIPVFLALLRMRFFGFVQRTFYVDLYSCKWNWKNIICILENVNYDWDVWLMAFLLVFILFNTRMHVQRFR